MGERLDTNDAPDNPQNESTISQSRLAAEPAKKEPPNMSEPFLAEVKMFGFNFAPRGWALCDGQILPINQNQSLYSLLGTTYGGDGRTSFALPDLRGRSPVHVGSSGIGGGPVRTLGQRSGTETVALTVAQIPNHQHRLQAM